MPFSDLNSAVSGAFWIPLADAIAKATLLLATAGVVSFGLRRRTAAARHLVWTLALLSSLALPALSIALPRWQLAVVTFAAPPAEVSAPATETPVHQAPAMRARRIADPTPPALSTAAPAADAIAAPKWSIPQVSWPVLLLLLWAAGAGVMLGRLALGLLTVQWMSRRTERVTDAPWLPLARALATELGISPRIVFLRSGRAAMPMAWGILRPSVLMPADADTWPAERLRIVLLHELAHVKRRDCLTHVLAQVSCALYWFNPLAWIAARHVRTERERACDDLVLAAGTRGADYADQLIEVARVMRAGRFPSLVAGASLAMAHRSQLEGRLMAILDPTVPRSGISRLRTAVATALFACAVMPLAALQPWVIASERSVVEAGTPEARADLSAAQTPSPTPSPTPTPSPSPTPSEVDQGR
jgi:beta-lactamase regulating signal transducer with metallopeptidase domain